MVLECGREDMLALLSNTEFQPRENSCAMDFLFLAQESYIEKHLNTEQVEGSAVIGLII